MQKEQKEYVFKFQGTKESFLNALSQFPNTGDGFYYFHDYIIKVEAEQIQFGIERAGHSGGYWFIPTITEVGDSTEFTGQIQYIGPKDDRSSFKKTVDTVGEFLLLVLLLPLILVIYLYKFIKWVIGKVCKRAITKPETAEEKLYDLMENHLNCIRL